MTEKIYAIRGAIAPVKNTEESITENTVELFGEILKRNRIRRIVSVIISSTNDLTAFYPATALRKARLTQEPLFSCAEPSIEGAMQGCIRILVTAVLEEESKIDHVYLGEAADLRPDLTKKEDNV